jgi:energy-coupling factor transport system permease protein
MSATLFLPRSSGFHRLNPLTKLTLALTAVVAASALETLPAVMAIFVFGLVPLAAEARVVGPFLRGCAKVIWPFALSLFPIQGFFAQGTHVILTLGPFSLKEEGLRIAALLTARLLVGLGAATLLMLTTRPDHLMHSLVQHGLPAQLSYIVVSALQLIPGFQARAQGILDAQRSRGLETEGSLRRRLSALVPLVSPLILGSLMDLEERAIALEARAFTRQGPKTSLVEIPDRAVDRALRWGLLLLAALLILRRVVQGLTA